jgi:hypothetical protein
MVFNVDDDEAMGWGWLVGDYERCDATLDWNVERIRRRACRWS